MSGQPCFAVYLKPDLPVHKDSPSKLFWELVASQNSRWGGAHVTLAGFACKVSVQAAPGEPQHQSSLLAALSEAYAHAKSAASASHPRSVCWACDHATWARTARSGLLILKLQPDAVLSAITASLGSRNLHAARKLETLHLTLGSYDDIHAAFPSLRLPPVTGADADVPDEVMYDLSRARWDLVIVKSMSVSDLMVCEQRERVPLCWPNF